jgi:hypothetical protein
MIDVPQPKPFTPSTSPHKSDMNASSAPFTSGLNLLSMICDQADVV